MNNLTIIEQNGVAYIDSREVAELIGKQHKHLLRNIRGYCEIIAKATKPTFGLSSFFLESSYFDNTGRELPCYLISKMGCEVVANKLTGEKGILFTVVYVSKFNEMEQRDRAELENLLQMPTPRLGEINACARIVIRGMKSLGATAEQIMSFIKETYEPLGISIAYDPEIDIDADYQVAPRWYRAGEIAKISGLYSLYGKPHAQAAACILNEIISIGVEHKREETEIYGLYTGVSVLYDSHALRAMMNWLIDNNLPYEIHGSERTYHVQYYVE